MLIIRIDDNSELRIYEEEHAGVVFAVVNQNREYLREWLPWVDSNVSVENTREFIRRGLVQQANNDGSRPASGTRAGSPVVLDIITLTG